MTEELLSTKQAAELLGMSQENISRMIKKGKLDGYKIGTFYAVQKESVLAYASLVNGKKANDPTRK
jgi:excisionase family DNA binding protein